MSGHATSVAVLDDAHILHALDAASVIDDARERPAMSRTALLLRMRARTQVRND
jgi:hypothetical protein